MTVSVTAETTHKTDCFLSREKTVSYRPYLPSNWQLFYVSFRVFLPWIYHFLMSVTGLFLDLICFFNWNIGHDIGLKTPFVLPSVFILANSHRLSRVTFLHKQLKYTSLRFDLSLKMYALFSNYCFILLDAILRLLHIWYSVKI